jgi:hypothetical protein
LVALK